MGQQTTRSCGTCRGCCRPFDIKAIGKRGTGWCVHSTPCNGCSIYSTRPTACKEYTCIWLDGLGKEEDKPELLGVVQNLHDFVLAGREITVLNLWEIEEGALKKPRIETIAENFIQEGLIVFYHKLEGNTYRNTIFAGPQFFTPEEIDLFELTYRN